MTQRPKVQTGIVVGDKMDKTVVVRVDRRATNRTYKKVVKKTKTFRAHDEKNRCHTGDRVRIVSSRPLSREKRWRVQQILVKAEILEPVADAPELGQPGVPA